MFSELDFARSVSNSVENLDWFWKRKYFHADADFVRTATISFFVIFIYSKKGKIGNLFFFLFLFEPLLKSNAAFSASATATSAKQSS